MPASAPTRQIEIIGEAAGRVSAERRASIPGVPGARVVGIRHRVIHRHFDVDPEVIWSTVRLDLPDLVREPEGALREGEQE